MRILQSAVLSAALFLAAAPVLAHDYKIGEVLIEHPWTRATPPSANVAGAYMVLVNNGAEADRLVGGSSPVADRVEIHAMDVVDDIMQMRQLADGLTMPAGEPVALEPGGYHLMMIGLDAPLAKGERVPLTLTFERAGSVEVELPVAAMGSSGSHDDHGGH